MRRFPLLFLGLSLLTGAGRAAEAPAIEAVAAGARTDLEKALGELATLRQQIEAERLPLARKVSDLERQVIEQRAGFSQAEREEGNQLVRLNALKAEVAARSNEVRYLEAFITEYRRAFETRLNVSERSRHQQPLAAARTAEEAPDLSPAEKLGRQLDFVGFTLQRLTDAIGGETFEGKALTPDRVAEPGRFLLLGPAAYFSSSRSGAAGVVVERLNSAEPNVVAVPDDQIKPLREVIAAGQGTLPVDASMGNAVRIRATRDTFAEHIAKGGPVMVPILLLGVVALLIFAVKWLQVGRVRTATAADLHLILNAIAGGQPEKALTHARALVGPVGEMLGMAIPHAGERKEYVEEVMYEKMLATRPRLERLVPFLALAAAAAPLLGLLGTVTGMINTFNMITVFGTGDPKTLAGGISEALITTEYGLIVAIPSLLLHAIINRKVKGVMGSMEQTTVSFINGLPSPSSETISLRKT